MSRDSHRPFNCPAVLVHTKGRKQGNAEGETVKYGSICSGIESASVAWGPLGFKCQFMSEIDKFPRAVLQHRFPEVPLHGDFTTIQRGDYGAIDILVGGTPCQSFSVAGLRAGLDDPRGNLMLGFGALAQRLTPQWLVWENVPGVLSSNGGRDFGTFLGMLAQLGFGVCFRILDSQFVRVESHPRAVPQRRRRVFVVGYFGDWRPAAAVLFERESLQGYPPPGRKAGKGLASDASPCIGASGRGFERTGETRGQDPVIAVNTSGNGYWREGVGTLRGREQESHEHLVASPLMNGSGTPAGHNARSGHCKDSHIVPVVSPAMKSRDCKGVSSDGYNDGLPLVCHSLRAEHDASEDGTGRGTKLVVFTHRRDDAKNETCIAFKSGQGSKARSIGASNELSPTLGSAESGTQLAPAVVQVQWASGGGQVENDAAQALRSGAEHSYQFLRTSGCFENVHAVRRLTPVECEILQGFPEGWTLIPWRGKPANQCPDGPRYKALGNAMAVNCMAWIGQRILTVSERWASAK